MRTFGFERAMNFEIFRPIFLICSVFIDAQLNYGVSVSKAAMRLKALTQMGLISFLVMQE
jgi:hypothetical protein